MHFEGIILLLLKIAIYVHLCSYYLFCSVFYFNAYKVLFLLDLCEMVKIQHFPCSKGSEVLHIFFSYCHVFSYWFQGKQEIHLQICSRCRKSSLESSMKQVQQLTCSASCTHSRANSL